MTSATFLEVNLALSDVAFRRAILNARNRAQ